MCIRDRPEPEPSLPSGDYLTEGLYFYGSWRADTDYSDMYAHSDLDYFRLSLIHI